MGHIPAREGGPCRDDFFRRSSGILGKGKDRRIVRQEEIEDGGQKFGIVSPGADCCGVRACLGKEWPGAFIVRGNERKRFLRELGGEFRLHALALASTKGFVKSFAVFVTLLNLVPP